MRVILRLLLLCFAVMALEAADEVVFLGVPAVRFDVDGKNSVRVDLSDQGAAKYTCRVVARKKKFYWASRGDRELLRHDAGDYTYFVSPQGTGIIKISLKPGGDYDYMEQFSSELKTVTYWGKRGK